MLRFSFDLKLLGSRALSSLRIAFLCACIVLKMGTEIDRLTDEILQRALATKHEVHWKDVKIKGLDDAAGSVRGDNLATVMRAVHVVSEIRGKAHSDDFMAKCMPVNEHREQMLKKVMSELDTLQLR